jgi:hypothetical protein
MRGDAILLGGTVVHERNERTQCWFPRDVAAKLFGIVRIAQELGPACPCGLQLASPLKGACQQLKFSRQARSLRDCPEAH